VLTETFHPVIGGGETQARLLTGKLVARGWPVVVVTRRSSHDYPAEERIDGVLVKRVPPSGANRVRKWAAIVTVYSALVQLREQWDVVLVSGFRILGMPAVLASARLGKGCVLKADSNGEMNGEYFRAGLASIGLSPSHPPVETLLKLRNRRLRTADAFVAISEPIADELLDAGVAQEKIIRIPNAADTERFTPVESAEKARLRAALGLPLDAFVVTYAGRLVRYKGLPLLLDAWATLCRDRTDALLVLVGAGTADIHSCETELREAANEGAMRGRVLFTGAVDDVHRYLRASDAFVFPTEEEAFGISLVEAMACGLPCVATHVGAIPEIADDGAALLVPPGDRSALDTAIRQVLDQPDLRERLGRAAHKRARSFSVDAVADSYGELFLRLSEARARAGGWAG
jgi:glycosyltransferase involved in cell wall biosynthesis